MVKTVGSKEFESISTSASSNNSIFVSGNDVWYKPSGRDTVVVKYDVSSESFIKQVGLATINQLIDRGSYFSNNTDDCFADAYVDSDGRNNYVNTGSTSAAFDTDEYVCGTTDSYVYHTISSGTFNSSITSSFCTVLIDGWEDGDSINYKLTNASDDTGWLDINKTTSFSSFSSEPTTFIIKLSPKTSTTTGYPSIKGVWLYAE